MAHLGDYEIDSSSLTQALAALERAIAVHARRAAAGDVEADELEVLQAGVIQRFSSTYELAWKFMKRWLEHNYSREAVDGVSRRELFRLSAEHRLIDDVDRWMGYHQARILTSHTYQVKLATAVFEEAILFVDDVRHFAARLQDQGG